MMQKTFICQPIINEILWEIFKRRHRTIGQPQREKQVRGIDVTKFCRKLFFEILNIPFSLLTIFEFALFWVQILPAVAANTVVCIK